MHGIAVEHTLWLLSIGLPSKQYGADHVEISFE